MTSARCFVSVIIPVYNGAAFLADAVGSIQRQGYSPLEIIIVDDGSTDGTAQAITRFTGEVRSVFQPNRGPAAARNAGLRMARGNVIGFLDADDLWPDDKLAIQLARLAEEPSIEIVLGRVQYLRIAADTGQPPRFERFSDPCVSGQVGSGLFRASVFEKVGGFDPTLRHGEDVDWFLRAREAGVAMALLDRVTLLYRIHPDNMTRDRAARDLYFIKALKQSLDRRRRDSQGVVESLPRLSDSSESIHTPPPHESR